MHPRHPGPQRHLAPHLADAIRQARIDLGLSWRQLASEVERSPGFLCQISRGERVPGRSTAQRLISVLELEPAIAAELLDVAYVPTPGRL